MKIYVFGNPDYEPDSLAFTVAKALEGKIKDITFVTVKPNEDLPFINEANVYILDTIYGIEKVTVLSDEDIARLGSSPRSSVHDFDLGFQLKYLKKLGKLGKVTIIGLPMEGNLDYDLIHSTLRKLVAQDIQGS